MSRGVQVLHNLNLDFYPLIFPLSFWGDDTNCHIAQKKDCSALKIQAKH